MFILDTVKGWDAVGCVPVLKKWIAHAGSFVK